MKSWRFWICIESSGNSGKIGGGMINILHRFDILFLLKFWKVKGKKMLNILEISELSLAEVTVARPLTDHAWGRA